MNRTPPVGVRRELRREVRFGCPVPECGNPYLSWHHFDPPWNERQHHEPSGMIALCSEHHAKADSGAFTKGQLRDLKETSAQRELAVSGKFDWMRNSILAVVGGNFFFETPIIFEFKGQPAIWFNRDDNGYLLLNVKMLTSAREPRVTIEDNFWLSIGSPDDLECPPSGKLLKVKYTNSDELKIEFVELESEEAVKKRYPETSPEQWGIAFPITAVEVFEKVGGTDFEFGPRGTRLMGGNMKNCFIRNCRVGLGVG
ncbi:HNH endonuclease [Desulfosporosinus fructosivorans]|uniref:HNH endonuclease n=1 Tax=Desulfosporosinus fructosivorans TaxID=2018669 RepID=A0A4Z0R771_9FIRM|nr:HNH endonuclease [Desulfosporosinus fructosivorans]TGE37506.1 HNH endonuclease [Desulfosporosinus fructosivorans]